MPRTRPSALRLSLLTLVTLASLALAGCPAAPPKKPLAGHGSRRGKSDPPPAAFDAKRFARRESAIYQHLDDLLRTCTIARNAQAGVIWVETLLGEKIAAQPPAAQRRAAARALSKARGQRLAPGELADLGWLVAETVRQAHGGTYAFDAKTRQVALTAGPGGDQQALQPMDVIARAYAGDKPLEAQLGAHLTSEASRLAPRSGDLPSCRDVRPVDVLQRRLAWR